MREPDFIIFRKPSEPYLRRWYIIPRNRWFNIYLHNTVQDDDPLALHDHPWWNVSIVLKGGYWEHMPQFQPYQIPGHPAAWSMQAFCRVWRRPGSIIFRRATNAHRLELASFLNDGISPVLKEPAWSLFITGPNRRVWGFWCETGWVPFAKYIRKVEGGNEVGAGCEE